MTVSALHIDFYQLTSLLTHHVHRRTNDQVVMTFFSRKLPQNPTSGENVRGYLIWAGLQRCLDYLESAKISKESIDTILEQPLLGPLLQPHSALIERLIEWKFQGRIFSPPEGTPIFCGAAQRLDQSPLEVDGIQPAAYCPFLVIETDLLSAKLIETPLLSLINHLTMVATKAAHVVEVAGERPVVEFGTRRTHPSAAVDAALAAYIGGCSATSNVEAYVRYGIPLSGTMDHFAVQAWEHPDQPRNDTEFAFFQAFYEQFLEETTLLVDTYDTFGSQTGIRNAVAATDGGPAAIRIDSGLSRENLWRARQLLDALGAIDTKILVSGGIDERKIAELGDAPIDGFGVGENLITSSDSPIGVGAVGKLSMIRGVPTTKISRGSNKAHLPGILQVWRTTERDIVGLMHEHRPLDGRPLLQLVWGENGRLPAPSWSDVRSYTRDCLAELPAERKTPRQVSILVSDALATLFENLVKSSVS